MLKELLDFMVGEWAAQSPFQSAVPAEEGCCTLVPCFPSCTSRTSFISTKRVNHLQIIPNAKEITGLQKAEPSG